MNETIPQKTTAAKPAGERTPIPIERLMFTSPNVHGVKLPDGPEGKGERITPNLTAGVHGDVKTEIDFRPWLRSFRVAKSKRITRTGTGVDAKEVVTWEPMGKPFFIPEAWAVWVPTVET